VVLHISLDAEEPIAEIDLCIPRKSTVHIGTDELEGLDIPEEAGYNLRVKVRGDAEAFKALKKTRKYKELTKAGVKIVFDARVEETKKKEVVTEGVDFQNILRELVEKSGSARLQQLYDDIAREILCN
jgi:predicted DNA binding CopG/RHH family protein